MRQAPFLHSHLRSFFWETMLMLFLNDCNPTLLLSLLQIVMEANASSRAPSFRSEPAWCRLTLTNRPFGILDSCKALSPFGTSAISAICVHIPAAPSRGTSTLPGFLAIRLIASTCRSTCRINMFLALRVRHPAKKPPRPRHLPGIEAAPSR